VVNRVQVAAGVIARNGRVLVCQRTATGRHPLKWEFPGGKLEVGETPAECVRRELREELGIEAIPGEELWRTSYDYASARVDLIFLRVATFAGEPQNLAFADLRWATPEDLPALDFLEADVGLVQRLARRELRL
jgi:8-oxo-dGTP diphosphatase